MKRCIIAESDNCFFKLSTEWRSPSAHPSVPWGLNSLTLSIQHFGHHDSLWIINKGNQLTHIREQHNQS